MRKIIGTGETILDIIFRNNQPERAVPGGSVFNAMVSLGRCGVPALFISELGNDQVGRLIKDFMIKNHLSPEYIHFFEDGSSPVSLAFLDEQQNASYQFYRDFPEKRLPLKFPEIQADDILILSSYFAVNPALRKEIVRLLTYAELQKAIIYYDINFRKPHAGERLQLIPYFIENFKFSTIVRCSSEDLEILFPEESVTEIYRKYIAPYCKSFIVTQGEKDILLKTEQFEKNYPVESLVPVSTIGAGDNFNAGILFGLMQEKILLDDLKNLSESQWDKLIGYGKAFASAVCRSWENYLPLTSFIFKK
ncbi:fructokinase [Bacteroidia bacterium]|nr:fructokinase [Bacteroidia bacterium]GHT60848.1 fructokinase [Bacteroidia bacterium]